MDWSLYGLVPGRLATKSRKSRKKKPEVGALKDEFEDLIGIHVPHCTQDGLGGIWYVTYELG